MLSTSRLTLVKPVTYRTHITIPNRSKTIKILKILQNFVRLKNSRMINLLIFPNSQALKSPSPAANRNAAGEIFPNRKY